MVERQTIAVDMDDVVIETSGLIIDYVNKTYNAGVTIDGFYSTDPALWGAPDVQTASRRVNEFLETEEYIESPPMQEAIHALRGLDRVHNLYIVTGRPDYTELATRKWLKTHAPDLFEDVVFTDFFDPEKVRTKGDVCRELGATVLVDDHPEHCKSALERGVRPLLFGNYPWNTDIDVPEGITRVAHWPDVEKLLLPNDED